MSYKKVTEQDIRFLKQICGEKGVLIGEDIDGDFGQELTRDIFMPEVLVEPATTQEASEIMKYAYANNIPVTPRGTDLIGSCIPIHGGILLNLSKITKLLGVGDNVTLKVEPSVLLMEVSKFVEQYDLFYPPGFEKKSLL